MRKKTVATTRNILERSKNKSRHGILQFDSELSYQWVFL